MEESPWQHDAITASLPRSISWEIEAPQERILPGRMIREMVRNLETRYELYEYSLIKSEPPAGGNG